MDSSHFFTKKFSMTNKDIIYNLELLNSEMADRGAIGELALVGGAVMCLVFKSRESTHDIDAIFEPKQLMYEGIKAVSEKNNLPSDWLNDSVKGFLSPEADFIPHLKMSNLSVLVASPEYLLAMKCLSARMDHLSERNDIKFLINYLNLRAYSSVEEIILKYYPAERFQVKTKYAVQEVLNELFPS